MQHGILRIRTERILEKRINALDGQSDAEHDALHPESARMHLSERRPTWGHPDTELSELTLIFSGAAAAEEPAPCFGVPGFDMARWSPLVLASLLTWLEGTAGHTNVARTGFYQAHSSTRRWKPNWKSEANRAGTRFLGCVMFERLATTVKLAYHGENLATAGVKAELFRSQTKPREMGSKTK